MENSSGAMTTAANDFDYFPSEEDHFSTIAEDYTLGEDAVAPTTSNVFPIFKAVATTSAPTTGNVVPISTTVTAVSTAPLTPSASTVMSIVKAVASIPAGTAIITKAPKHRFDLDNLEVCKKTYMLATDAVGLSERFVAQAEGKFKFIVELDLWMMWTGKVWKADPAGLAVDILATKVALSIKTVELKLALKADNYMIELETRATAARKELESVDTEDAKTQLAAAEGAPGKYAARLKRDAEAASDAAQKPYSRKDMVILSRDYFSTSESEWGGPDDLLNVQNGIVDLRTKEIMPHDSKYMMRNITPVRYVPGATHKYVEQVLEHLTGGDAETEAFVRRFVGTGATGSTDHRAFIFFKGPAQVGKSALNNATAAALGETRYGGYAVVVEIKHLMLSRSDHQAGFNNLRGARFGMLNEATTDRGTLDVARINALVGGDPISSRGLYEDETTWKPKITLSTNGNEDLYFGVDNAGMQERFIPMEITRLLPANQRKAEVTNELTLTDEGREAWLAMMIDGAADWYERGGNYAALGVPAHLEYAKETYRAGIDDVAAWIEDRMIDVDDTHTQGYPMTVAQAQASFRRWQKDTGREKTPGNKLMASLTKKGYTLTQKEAGKKNFPRWDKISGRRFSQAEEYPVSKQYVLGLYPTAGVNTFEGNFRGTDLLNGNVPLDPTDQLNYPGSNLHNARAA